jgi:hypothetical protein
VVKRFMERHYQSRSLGLVVATVLVFALATTAYAWSVSARYVHTYNTSWSADDGYHRGQVEWYSGVRYIRAGDDYVRWNSYSSGGNGHLAMVYHAFQPNSNSCGHIRVGDNSWSWSNLPGVSFSTKGCFSGGHNEWRANVYGAIVPGTFYYFQHLFRDTNNNSGIGEITTNTYWVNYSGDGPYHGKFCINSTSVYAVSPQTGRC